jgi:excisionase family DNA binding protein
MKKTIQIDGKEYELLGVDENDSRRIYTSAGGFRVVPSFLFQIGESLPERYTSQTLPPDPVSICAVEIEQVGAEFVERIKHSGKVSETYLPVAAVLGNIEGILHFEKTKAAAGKVVSSLCRLTKIIYAAGDIVYASKVTPFPLPESLRPRETNQNPKPLLDGSDPVNQQQAAEYLKVSKSTVRRWQRDGLIRVHKVNRACRYYKKELDEDVQKNRLKK